MARFLHQNAHLIRRNEQAVYLALCWLSGLVAGCSFSASAGPLTASLMCMTCSGPVSIVSLLIVTLLPLLCSAFAVYISRSWLLFFIAFIKAFLLGFTALGIYAAFGSSGWVFRFFLMFSDLGMLPFLYLFWLQHLPGGCGICRRDSMFLLCGMAIAGIDYAFISPFWAGL